MRIGNLTVDAVRDGTMIVPTAALYDEMPSARWEPWRHLLHDGTEVVIETGGHLIRGEGANVLVDAGVGPAREGSPHPGALLDSLAALGVRPEEVTDVVFSHLHFDHVGWASDGVTPTFPNATYHAHARDWRHFVMEEHPLSRFEEALPAERLPSARLAPIRSRLLLWEERAEIVPGLTVHPMPGHTPGTTLIEVSSEGDVGYLLGDIAHHQVELLEPDWQGVSDVDVDAAREARRAVAAMLAECAAPVTAVHFRNFEWGRVKRVDGRLAWEGLGEYPA